MSTFSFFEYRPCVRGNGWTTVFEDGHALCHFVHESQAVQYIENRIAGHDHQQALNNLKEPA